MKADAVKFLAFLKKSNQFTIPIYQRTYSWTESECEQLWKDIFRTGSDPQITSHFIGSIVYIEKGLYQVSSQNPLLVIDGQQRLTTLTLVLAALVEELMQLEEAEREPLEGFSPKKLKHYYLVNSEEEGEKYFKLLLSQTDKESLKAIVANREISSEKSVRIFQNYHYFRDQIKKHHDHLKEICQGLSKLIVVDISLDREQDNPQLIFESMNSTGKELSQADLIRNYILMDLEPELQTRLYQDYWYPMEKEFGQEAYVALFDRFIRDYLTAKTGDLPNIRDIYETFKNIIRKQGLSVEELVKEIRNFARYYCAFALGHEKDKELAETFHDLRELKVDVAYPFILNVYHDYTCNIINKTELISIIRLIEAYVFRRAICGIASSSTNKTFASAYREIDTQNYLHSVQAHFMNLRTYRRFPRNEEFQRDFQIRDLYNFRNRSYWLRRMENFERKERINVDEYTIEHILPQNPNLSEDWKKSLGPDWERIQANYLHTLGNLTLTGYNSEYRDKPFKQKREMQGGFRFSPLRLNQGLAQIEDWNENQIIERAKSLSEFALKVWGCPEGYANLVKPVKSDAADEYSAADHPRLALEPIQTLYTALKNEILALDPNIKEEFLKRWIAFKAERSIVDIELLAKQLKLFLNMPFESISDERNICQDKTDLGHWGNGNVLVYFSDLQDLPYIMGLIRQVFEWQMEPDS